MNIEYNRPVAMLFGMVGLYAGSIGVTSDG